MARKALISVGMLVGFYVLSAALIAALVGMNVVMWNSGRIDFRLLIFSLFVIFALLRATFFVSKNFEGIPGGVLITSQDHPDLFRSIESIANQMGTTPPDEVYLVQDVNAFVMEDTRLLGLISKKRVMAVGVGLMNAMTVDEVEAVLAHEYGHYAGSDTRLGAVTYRGWESIVRTVQGLSTGWVRSLFVWYANLYLRITRGVSREQELSADVWSAKVGGKPAAISAFQKLSKSGLMYQFLLNNYVSPLTESKVRPDNMYQGFRQLLSSESRDAETAAYLEENPIVPSPYDSHPPIPERVAALEAMEAPSHERDDRPGRELLTNPDATERLLTESLFVNPAQFEAVAWADAGPHFVGASFGFASAAVAAMGSNGSAQFLQFLIDGNHAEIKKRLQDSGRFNTDNLSMEQIVSQTLPALVGLDRGWTVNWDGPIRVPVDYPEEIVGQLLAGGAETQAAIARYELK